MAGQSLDVVIFHVLMLNVSSTNTVPICTSFKALTLWKFIIFWKPLFWVSSKV